MADAVKTGKKARRVFKAVDRVQESEDPTDKIIVERITRVSNLQSGSHRRARDMGDFLVGLDMMQRQNSTGRSLHRMQTQGRL